MDTNTINIRSGSLWCCLCVLSNTYAAFEAYFMKKLDNTEADLKKCIAYKKSVKSRQIRKS